MKLCGGVCITFDTKCYVGGGINVRDVIILRVPAGQLSVTEVRMMESPVAGPGD